MLSCAGADLAESEAWSDLTELFDPKKTTTSVIEGKIISKINDLRENKNYFELAGGSSNYSKYMTEIQGKSILVQVNEALSYGESIVYLDG